jgi:hypothetical protein
MSQLSEYNHSTDSEKKKEDWMNAKWRPMMGWMYMFVCVFDFVLAPIGWTSIQALFHGGISTQWQPLTLQGGGLFHVAMGAVIGISAYGRTKEKLEGVAGSNQPMGTQYVPPGGMPGQMGMGGMGGMNSGMGGMNSGMGGGFNNGGGFGGSTMGGGSTYGAPSTGGFGSPAPAFGSTPAPAFGSTPAPAFGSTPAPAFGTPPTLTTTPPPAATGKPSGPAQSFPAL